MSFHRNPITGEDFRHLADCDGPGCDRSTRTPLVEPWVELVMFAAPAVDAAVRHFCDVNCLAVWLMERKAL